MIIHVVQQGETTQSIAESYGIPETILIQDNGLEKSKDLVVGQSLVIVVPELTYTVKEGDSLLDIANSHNVTIMQLFQNNPYLSERKYIFPGDIIVISYNKQGTITTHGNTSPYINKDTLRKTLPYLTYLSVLNYTVSNVGEIISTYDDTEIIQTARDFGVMPLMLLTTLTIQGEENIGTAYNILLNQDIQNRLMENLIIILKDKGYSGVNLSLEFITTSNMELVNAFFSKAAERLNEEGFLLFSIINPNISNVTNEVIFERADYSLIDQISEHIIFMNYHWAKNTNPPAPISSITNMEVYLAYLIEFIFPYKIITGVSAIGYDWELPYYTGISNIYTLTADRAIDLARNEEAIIQFDEISQTPFFRYTVNNNGQEIEHIVWFIDSRTIDALLGLFSKFELLGTGVWNITIYSPQLWLIINSQYEIEKVLID